jgi:hypothetical protein
MTQTFGDSVLAGRLYSRTKNNGSYNNDSPAPKGFKKIGSGCYRVAYLHRPTEIVYKVGSAHTNLEESRNARALSRRSTRGMRFNLHIPRTRTYLMNDGGRVIAQEFAKGAKGTYCSAIYGYESGCSCEREVCFATVLDTIRKWSGLEDIHEKNVLVDKKNVFWFIDLAQ